jgi:hypothetical protein
MIGRQGKAAKAMVGTPIMGKKPAGKVVGAGGVKIAATPKGIKGNNKKIK